MGVTADPDGPIPVPVLHRASERQLVALDVALAAVLLAAGLLKVDGFGLRSADHVPGWVANVLVVLGTAPVAVRRRVPLPSLMVMVAATATLTGIGRPPLALDLSTGLAAYTVAVRWQRRPALAAFMAAEVVLGIGVTIAIARGVAGSYVVHTMLVVAVTWFAGDSVRNRRRYEASMVARQEHIRLEQEERHRQAVREERVQIARELHDVVAHSLTVMTVQAGVASRVGQDPDGARSVLQSIESIGRAAQQELQVILGLLRDERDVLPDLEPAPCLDDLGTLIDQVRVAGLPVEFEVCGERPSPSPAVELSVYRIVQESLTNVVKHAGRAHTTVRLAYRPEQIVLEVVDEGPVGSPTVNERQTVSLRGSVGAGGSPGHGILGMRERVAAFGGTLVAEQTPGRGFRVRASIPVREA